MSSEKPADEEVVEQPKAVKDDTADDSKVDKSVFYGALGCIGVVAAACIVAVIIIGVSSDDNSSSNVSNVVQSPSPNSFAVDDSGATFCIGFEGLDKRTNIQYYDENDSYQGVVYMEDELDWGYIEHCYQDDFDTKIDYVKVVLKGDADLFIHYARLYNEGELDYEWSKIDDGKAYCLSKKPSDTDYDVDCHSSLNFQIGVKEPYYHGDGPAEQDDDSAGQAGCTDFPDWVDEEGWDCEFYERADEEGCPSFGETPGQGGLFTANQACCHCGGGVPDEPGGDDDDESPECVDYPDWVDEEDAGCDFYERADEEGSCDKFGDTPGSDGLTAKDACCHCGGGLP